MHKLHSDNYIYSIMQSLHDSFTYCLVPGYIQSAQLYTFANKLLYNVVLTQNTLPQLYQFQNKCILTRPPELQSYANARKHKGNLR